ncbi:MAG TPA: PAS domain-containing sensor histidine kinase, partial [Bdellovibrionota bacterium]|nr:PAS domain-containing sensor histidine kinase [Bdellovibrionota bacterium]
EGAKRIKGYDYPEVVGKNFSMFYTDEDLNAGKPEYELKEASLTGRFEDEGWRVRKDGSMLWANVVLTAIRDRNRKLVGFTKVTRDLTEQKRADLRLQRAHADLEKRVEARTNELASSNELLKAREKQLEEAVRVRDEFLSIASHELKTPITSLRMQIQMIRARTRPEKSEMPDPRKLAHSLDTSLRQVDRLTGLVDDLLDVARAQAGKLTYRFEKLDLAALVSEVVERHAEQFEEASCPLELEAPKPVVGQFDRFRMEQVVENLITNAIKYARGTPVRVSIANRDGVAVLEISDGGPGISSELEARIFERFERGASARNLGGLGLGLYITRQIVEGHRGAVRVTNGAENGARFIVELPLNLIALRDPEGSGSP